IDTASYAEESDAIFVDLAAGTARRGSAAAPIEDTLAAIENVTGGSGGDTLSGNGGANTLDGGAGNDSLNITGTAGADTLDVLFDGAGLTAFEGGTVTGVEAITADLLGG